MSDMGDMFNDWKKEKQKKRQSNTEYSTNKLKEHSIAFDSRNYGTHLIVQARKEVIDFWPSTGKFICRTSGRQGRGIRNVLKLCGIVP